MSRDFLYGLMAGRYKTNKSMLERILKFVRFLYPGRLKMVSLLTSISQDENLTYAKDKLEELEGLFGDKTEDSVLELSSAEFHEFEKKEFKMNTDIAEYWEKVGN